MRRRLLLIALLHSSLGSTPAWATPLIAAHRGLVEAGVSENSLEAIRSAADAGLDAVEIDLRTTADGVIILSHDATVDRVTTGHGRVSHFTLAEIRALSLKAGSGHIATFEEALEATKGRPTRLLLDLKRAGGIDPGHLIAVAQAHDALDRIIVGARSVGDVLTYRRIEPSLPILGFIPTQSDSEAFIAAGAGTIRLWVRWLTQPAAGCTNGASANCVVQRLQARGLRVWTIADAPSANEPAKACFAWLASLQLDGILTSQPLLAREMSLAGTRDSVPHVSNGRPPAC
jgi:glycerophosphoryl diester phosphodiesterase